MAELHELLKILGHYYATDPGSNIAKFLTSHANRIDEIRAILDDIQDNRYLDTATGYSLDLIGAKLSLGRETEESDKTYRRRLKLEIMILISQGRIEEIREILAEGLQIDDTQILIYNNQAPSQGLTDLPFFCEISLDWGAFLLDVDDRWFKFSDTGSRTTGSARGFDIGKWKGRSSMHIQHLAEVNELVERILGTGVQYQIAAHGGFRFSLNPTTRTDDSSYGFNSGHWRRVIG
jgi:hypothetical protein